MRKAIAWFENRFAFDYHRFLSGFYLGHGPRSLFIRKKRADCSFVSDIGLHLLATSKMIGEIV